MKLTEYLAIYAAILSTIVFLWNIGNSRPRFSVQVVFSFEGTGSSKLGVCISIKNMSMQAVNIVSLSLLAPYKSVSLYERLSYWIKYRRFKHIGWMHMPFAFNDINTKLPVTIQPYHAHNIFVPEEVIWRILEGYPSMNFAVAAQDALWRSRTSKLYVMHLRAAREN